MVEDFVLLKRITAKLKTEEQWLVKTALGDPAYKELGRWSRWRRHPDKRVGGFELLEAQISLKELAVRIRVLDQTSQKSAFR
jgi:hypothetical protein